MHAFVHRHNKRTMKHGIPFTCAIASLDVSTFVSIVVKECARSGARIISITKTVDTVHKERKRSIGDKVSSAGGFDNCWCV